MRRPSLSDRAVSTVVDVALALLCITASVAIVGLYLADSSTGPVELDGQGDATVVVSGDHDARSAAQVTETLAESTITVTYSTDAVSGEDEFSEPVITDATSYTRTDHGSPLGLLADAAIANHQIDGEPVLAYGEAFEEEVDWAIRQNLIGADQNIYVVAEWEPYDGAAFNGTATAGERPPPTADVSSTTTTVPSGFSAVDEEQLEADWMDADDWWDEWINDMAGFLPDIDDSEDVPGLDGSDNKSYAAAGTVIGEEIVDGLFPPDKSQYALEDQGMERELKVYHYQSIVHTIGDFSFRSPDTHPPLVRTEARAEDANRNVLVGREGGYDFTDADALAAWIGADIPRAFEDEFEAIDEEYDGDERDERKVETVIEALSNDDVTITIQTWNE